MATAVLIIGEPGTGKSTSIRNLKTEETFIINVIGKPLPFRHAKKLYTQVTQEGGNYIEVDEYSKIIKVIQGINSKRPDIKNLIIDDFQYVLSFEFMRRATEKSYEKFTEIAQHAWMMIKEVCICRQDLACFFLSHSDTDSNGKVGFKSIGKMLQEKISVEGLFTIVLHSLIVDSKYKFLTQNDGIHIAKSPMGMFEERLIDNDLNDVLNKIHTYYNEDIE